MLIGPNVAVFPYGTTRDDSGIRFSDGRLVEVPGEAHLGGGYYDLSMVKDEWPIVPMGQVEACLKVTDATGFVWAGP